MSKRKIPHKCTDDIESAEVFEYETEAVSISLVCKTCGAEGFGKIFFRDIYWEKP